MHIVILFVLTVALVFVAWNLYTRVPGVPSNLSGSWGSKGHDDPRVATAAMLHAIANEAGTLTAEKEREIVGLLSRKLGIDRGLAKMCLTAGRRLDFSLKGSLNARLHKLAETIERRCTPEERRDVVEMLRVVAGDGADRIGSIRDGLGRVSATLLHG